MTNIISKIKKGYQCYDKTFYLSAMVIWLFFSNVFYFFYNGNSFRIFRLFTEIPIEKFYLAPVFIAIYTLIADSLFEPNKTNRDLSYWGGIFSCSLCFFHAISESSIGFSSIVNRTVQRIVTIISDAASYYKESNEVAYYAMGIMLVIMVFLLLYSGTRYGYFEITVYCIFLALGASVAILLGALFCASLQLECMFFFVVYLSVFGLFQSLVRRYYYPSCHKDLMEITINNGITNEWNIHDESVISFIILGILVVALILALILGKADNLKTIIELLLPEDNYSTTIETVQTQRNYLCFFMTASAYLTAVLVPAIIDFICEKIPFINNENSKVFSINKSLLTVTIQIYWFSEYAKKISGILMDTDNVTGRAFETFGNALVFSRFGTWILDGIEAFMGDNVLTILIGAILFIVLIIIFFIFLLSLYSIFMYGFAYFFVYFVIYLFLCILSFNCMNFIGVPTIAILSVVFLSLINKFIDSMMCKFVRFGRIVESFRHIKSAKEERSLRDLKENQKFEKWLPVTYFFSRKEFARMGIKYEDIQGGCAVEEEIIKEGIEKKRLRKAAVRATVNPWDRPEYKRAYLILKNIEIPDGEGSVSERVRKKKPVISKETDNVSTERDLKAHSTEKPSVKKDVDYDFDYEFDESELHFDIEEF